MKTWKCTRGKEQRQQHPHLRDHHYHHNCGHHDHNCHHHDHRHHSDGLPLFLTIIIITAIIIIIICQNNFDLWANSESQSRKILTRKNLSPTEKLWNGTQLMLHWFDLKQSNICLHLSRINIYPHNFSQCSHFCSYSESVCQANQNQESKKF